LKIGPLLPLVFFHQAKIFSGKAKRRRYRKPGQSSVNKWTESCTEQKGDKWLEHIKIPAEEFHKIRLERGKQRLEYKDAAKQHGARNIYR
jgi:hypothetical protein